MIALAALLCVALGLSLGMLGGGGSILAVPVLVYVAGIEPRDAVSLSLVLVGATSALAGIWHARRGNVDLRAALSFGGVGVPAALVGARFTAMVPAPILLGMFAALLVAVAAWMAIGRPPATVRRRSSAVIAAAGAGAGMLTGFLGVGGGFVVVPALTSLGGLETRRAIGTSLLVIAMNSGAGAVGHLGQGSFPLGPAALFTASAIGGAIAGERLARRVDPRNLRRTFAILVGLIGVLVAWQVAAS